MRELGMITPRQFADADKEMLPVRQALSEFGVRAHFFAEMVRAQMFERFGEEAYTRGLKVHTTLHSEQQRAAYAALRKGVLEYDRRHGYRGPEAYVELSGELTDERLEDALQDVFDSDDLHVAVVLEASPKRVLVYRAGGERIVITDDGLKFAARLLGGKAAPAQRIRRGAIVRITRTDKGRWQLTQLPAVESALVAANPRNGASGRWSAALTSTATSSITSPRHCASRDRASSRLFILLRWRRVLPRPPWSTMPR